MNITLGWFFNIPGIFITAGVVLIIIALIVFIIANKKEKASKDGSQQFGVSNGTVANAPQEGIQSGIAVNPVPSTDQNVANSTVNPVNVTPVEQHVANPISNVDIAKEDSVASLMKSVTVAPSADSTNVDTNVNPIPNVSVEPVTVNEPVVENVSVSPVENPVGVEINPANAVETNNIVPSTEPAMPIDNGQEMVTPIISPVESVNVETPVVSVPENVQRENVAAPVINNDVTLTPNVMETPDVIAPVDNVVQPVEEVPPVNPSLDAVTPLVTPEITPVDNVIQPVEEVPAVDPSLDVVSPLAAPEITPVDNVVQPAVNNPIVEPVLEAAPVQEVNPTVPVQNDAVNNVTEEKKEDIEEI